jgi:hypothetical protein
MLNPPILEIMICTMEMKGLNSIISHQHPRIEGVGYLVVCQYSGAEPEIPEGLRRDDFRILFFKERGLSRNRNRALEAAAGEWLLISDDDVDYTGKDLTAIRDFIAEGPDSDILTLRSNCTNSGERIYPNERCDFKAAVKGYYATSIELLLRRRSVCGKIWFNEEFGIGAPHLISGEEDIFIESCLRAGMRIEFIPLNACSHPHATTSEREALNPLLNEARGAVYRYKYPHWWWLRLALFGLRGTIKGTLKVSLREYLRHTFHGAVTYGAKAASTGGERPATL